MRLIGNKSKLLGPIEEVLAERGVRSGTLIDIFSGTASVGRRFKRRGFRVLANDRLSFCHTRAVAAVEVSRWPAFRGLRRKYRESLRSPAFRRDLEAAFPGHDRRALPLLEAIQLLRTEVPPREGIVSRCFSDGGTAGRAYFTAENGRRIDGVLDFLREESRSGVLQRRELHLLLSALLDAADRVANISGTYGAWLKDLQASSRRPLHLEPPEVIENPCANRAFQEDANRLVRRLKGDVLYVDPPYNRRQYAANYHVLEILAEHHRAVDLSAFEASFYGKTGLLPYRHLRSAYCVPRGGRGVDVHEAMRDLLLAADVDHVVISYNEEGLLERGEIASLLEEYASRPFDWGRDFHCVLYKRFRSDRNRPDGGSSPRRYRVLDGRQPDELAEWIFVMSRDRRRSGRRRAAGRRTGRSPEMTP